MRALWEQTDAIRSHRRIRDEEGAHVRPINLFTVSLVNNIYPSIKLRASSILIRALYYTSMCYAYTCASRKLPRLPCFYNPRITRASSQQGLSFSLVNDILCTTCTLNETSQDNFSNEIIIHNVTFYSCTLALLLHSYTPHLELLHSLIPKLFDKIHERANSIRAYGSSLQFALVTFPRVLIAHTCLSTRGNNQVLTTMKSA